MEFGRVIRYSILIEPTYNKGFIVQVGCGKFVFSNKEDLKEAFNEYIDNPKELEERYDKTIPIPSDMTDMNYPVNEATEKAEETGLTSRGFIE